MYSLIGTTKTLQFIRSEQKRGSSRAGIKFLDPIQYSKPIHFLLVNCSITPEFYFALVKRGCL